MKIVEYRGKFSGIYGDGRKGRAIAVQRRRKLAN